MDIVDYLLNNTFSSEDLKEAFEAINHNRETDRKVEIFDENTTVIEGTQAIVKTKVYKRSSKLREKAIKFYTLSATQGNPTAQFNLANMYRQGVGVKQDYIRAFKLYTESANQGDSDAQNSLGIMYYNGNGIKKDKSKAYQFLLKAGAQEHTLALQNMMIICKESPSVCKE